MIRTPLCDLLGIEHPVFQGGMAWIADASLAAAVSEAGGLGIIAAMNADADWLRGQIRELRSKTDKPFGVNVMLMSPFADEVAQVVAEEHVPVAVTGAGNPTKYMAAWMGATAVVAEGGESGGHVGDLTTMALVPQVVDAVDIPVLAAGGIADGRGVAAAFMLGAQGVQVGTRFLVAQECTVSQEYKNRVLKAKDLSTVVTGRRTGHPVRSLKSPFTTRYVQIEKETLNDDDLHGLSAGALRKAAQEGDGENGQFMCGQIAAIVTREEPAAAIVEDLMAGAEKILRGATQWLS